MRAILNVEEDPELKAQESIVVEGPSDGDKRKPKSKFYGKAVPAITIFKRFEDEPFPEAYGGAESSIELLPEKVPLYGYSRSPYFDFLSRNMWDRNEHQIRLLPDVAFKDINEKPDVKLEYLSDKKTARPHTAENDNTYVAPKPIGRAENREGSRFMDGVKSAIKESEQAWKYLGKEVQKNITQDPEKRAKLDKEQQQIVDKRNQMPETKGWGKVGEYSTNLATTGLPTVLAGMLGGPGAATVLGGGLMALDAAKSASKANMEMDSYEKATGKKISAEQRATYSAVSVAADAMMNAALGGKLMKKLPETVEKTLKDKLKDAIMRNPIAQSEFNTMTRNVMKQEREKWAQEAIKNTISSAVEGGAASGAMEAAKGIYTEETPELNNIAGAVLGGFLAGAGQGAGASVTRGVNMHQQRMQQDDTFYGSNTTHKSGEERLPITEFRPTRIERDANGNITRIEGHTVDATGRSGGTVQLPIENISVGSYDKAHRSGATTDKRDSWDISRQQMEQYRKQWDDAKDMKEKNPEKSYEEQNKVLQSIATEMGVPINVYAKTKDLPPELRNHPEVKKSYAVTVDDNTINVVLDQCEGLSADNLASIIRHEAVGHYGMNKNYETQGKYEQDLNEAGKPLIPIEQQDKIPSPHSKGYAAWLQRLEERASRKAETREYKQPTDEQNQYNKMYEMLRKSEENIRSTTINELRKNNDRRGKPMPTLYEMEEK